MRNEKHQQAKNLYFQTDLSKTAIADRLGVNRRTIMLWCQNGNWDRMKLSAQHMPSIVAEKCYFLLDHYTTHLLSSNAVISTFGPKEANAISQMATSIKKLKNRSAINEAMEMFNFFTEYVKKQDPEMLEFVTPLVEGYIASRRDVNIDSFVPASFTSGGFMDEEKREQEIIERWKDEDDQPLMEEEYFEFLKYREQKMKENNQDLTDDDIPQSSPKDKPVSPASPASSCHPEHVEGSAKESPADSSCHPELVEGCHGEPRRTMTAEKSAQADSSCHPGLVEGCHGEPCRTMTAGSGTAVENYTPIEISDPELDELELDPYMRAEFIKVLQSDKPVTGFEALQQRIKQLYTGNHLAA